MDILLLYMAEEGGRGVQADLKCENVCHVHNFISATPLHIARAHNLLSSGPGCMQKEDMFAREKGSL